MRPAKAPRPGPQHGKGAWRPSAVLSFLQQQPHHNGQALWLRPAPAVRPRPVSRGCQTLPPAVLRLPRPCSTTLPMPWGVEPRDCGRPTTPGDEPRRDAVLSVEQELAELLGYRSMSSSFASAFGLNLASLVGNGGREEPEEAQQQPWNPRPPPDLHEGVEVAWESRQQRCVATNTSHVTECLRPVKRSRRKQWRRAALSWRRR